MAEHIDALAKNKFAEFGTHLVVGPMYHTGPLSGVRLLAAGVPVVVLGRFDAEARAARRSRPYRTETSVMVPTHFVRLLALPEEVRARYDVSSMKLVAHTGAACPIDVKRQMIEWWGPVLLRRLRRHRGRHHLHDHQPRSGSTHPGSVGRAIPPFTALVVDDDGNELPPEHRGPAVLRGLDRTGHRVPERPREDGGRPPAARRVHARRDRLHRRRRLRLHHRPLQRHDRVGRRQHLPGRGRAGADRAPRRWPTSPSSACPTPTWARTSRRSSCPPTPPIRRRGRADRVLPRAAGGLQVPPHRSTSSRPSVARRWAR